MIPATAAVAASNFMVARIAAAGAWIAVALAAAFVVACTAAVLLTADAADLAKAVARIVADRGDGGFTVIAQYRL